MTFGIEVIILLGKITIGDQLMHIYYHNLFRITLIIYQFPTMTIQGGLVSSQAITWVLGATGDSCVTTCSNYLPSATCNATATW